MVFKIPGRDTVEINDVLFDYNGTIAIDGRLIEGVAESINKLAGEINFHIITADTFGSVEKALSKVDCKVVKIPEGQQDTSKLDYLHKLGKEKTMSVGNGRNDRLMLKESVIGVVLVQDEGACIEAFMAADIVCKSVMDVFAFFKTPNRMKATLRN